MDLANADRADVVIPFHFRFVWGRLSSTDELAFYLAARSPKHGPAEHWSDYVIRSRSIDQARKDLGLLEFCRHFERVELWFDPNPNDQLQLIWLLDCFRSLPQVAGKLRVVFVDFDLLVQRTEDLARWRVPNVDVTEAELEMASRTWQAYRSPTPQACFDLISGDLGALPLLRPALINMLDELPSATTGLGWTELRLLELIARGCSQPAALFYHRGFGQRIVFNDWEVGYLLEGLAFGPTPAIAGLDEELRTIKRGISRTRLEAIKRSRLSLTDFGWAVAAHKKDFSQHNPIRRWWGGTELTNDRLWRSKPTLTPPSIGGGQAPN
jgi:hypothetical protein